MTSGTRPTDQLVVNLFCGTCAREGRQHQVGLLIRETLPSGARGDTGISWDEYSAERDVVGGKDCRTILDGEGSIAKVAVQCEVCKRVRGRATDVRVRMSTLRYVLDTMTNGEMSIDCRVNGDGTIEAI